jgi:hypothetical protein
MPQRIQRRRTAGWRMPDGAIYVGRPSKWGNPFSELQIGCAYPSLNEDQVHAMAVAQFRDIAGKGRDITLNERIVGGRGDRERVTYTYPPLAEIVAELAGHDLACWCRPDELCHADVLLELANQEAH